ncbi:radical SAM protein [bacterium]|nr:radical SAM protein [bacterium]
MRYVFGPVPSRRLGNSLGVDLLATHVCSYDCVYCQLGRTVKQTSRRDSFVPWKDVVAEVGKVLRSGAEIDYITLSGSGEPTLSLDIGRVVGAIKKMTGIPVAVLTNASLLWREEVREDVRQADVVIPSFDAATQEAFDRINRPLALASQLVADGIRDLARECDGRVWLEVMVVAGVNDTLDEARAILHALQGARLDRVQLNTVARVPAESWVQPVSDVRLEEIASVLAALAPVDVIHHYNRAGHESFRTDVEDVILSALARRPCGAHDLAKSLGLTPTVVAKHVGALEHAGHVERVDVSGQTQYRVRQAESAG